MTLNLQAIVLAAGKSTRFNTNRTKLLETICGQELILYPLKLLATMKIPTTLVVGFQKDLIIEAVTKHLEHDVHYVIQEEQHGTGHAIICARDSFKEEHILIINGDMPLITANIIEKLYQKHIATKAAVSFITAHNNDPSASTYSRVIKQEENKIKIVEPKEIGDDLYDHCCIDAGMYIVTKSFLEKHLAAIEKNDKAHEFYFTDLIKIACEQNELVTTTSEPFDRIRGINNFQELWAAEQIKRSELIKYWMDQGVRFSVAQNVHIDLDVTIGSGTRIGCGVHIIKGSKIGANCFIHESASIENSILEDSVTVLSHCLIKDSHIGNSAIVGPFAHVSNDSSIGAYAEIGNFVQVKRSTIGQHTKAKHLAYLGDATIGSNVNIGAGTIICNYDGFNKFKTTIQDGVNIGSNNTLIAPITIEKNSYTAAGSTITTNVPEDALAIGRARQINKEGYAKKMRQKNGTEEESSSFVPARKTNNSSKISEGS